MTTDTTLLGVLAAEDDPVAQALELSPGFRGQRLIGLFHLADVPKNTPILLTSQRMALAHGPLVTEGRRAVTVLLRRPDPSEGSDLRRWQLELELFAKLLDAMDGGEDMLPAPRLLALSEEAAEMFRKILGRPVEPLPAMARPPARSFGQIEIDPAKNRAQVSGDAPRRMRLSMVNLARIACQAVPVVRGPAESDLADLDRFLQANPAADAQPRQSRVMFVVPNGVGLGHVTRLLAIAETLRREHATASVFWCFSRGAAILQAAGHQTVLRQTAGHLKEDETAWRQRETAEFAYALGDLGITAVGFDGSTPDPFVFRALASPGNGRIGLIWVRRGMWQQGSNPLSMDSEAFCDLVLIPGDLAEAADMGPTARYRPERTGLSSRVQTAPVTVADAVPALDRRRARQALGLGLRDRRTCLVSLGGDAFGDLPSLQETLLRLAHEAGVTLIWARSPLAGRTVEPGLRTVDLFPLSRYFAAFDGVISAAGYNSFHELMLHSECPVLFIPTINARLDDQEARARHAAAQGWAEVALPQDDRTMTRFLGRVARKERDQREAVPRGSGNAAAAEAIAAVCRHYAWRP